MSGCVHSFRNTTEIGLTIRPIRLYSEGRCLLIESLHVNIQIAITVCSFLSPVHSAAYWEHGEMRYCVSPPFL